jgi:hypothetical protein
MSASAPRKDPRHRRTNLRPSRVGGRSRARQPIIAVLLGVVGFALLVAYSAIGAGGAVANAADTTEISAKALTSHDCDDTEWHFIITGIKDGITAPTTIHVTWSNGAVEDVPLDGVNGQAASYTTTSNLTSTVVSATAVIDSAWLEGNGQFNLSHGPCGTPSSTPPSTPSTPPSTPSTPPSTPTTPPSTPTTPVSSSSGAISSSSGAISSSSSEVVISSSAPAQGTSPFVPGPGETGDTAPASTPILKQGLLAGGLASLVAALGMSLQMLKRRGEHS